jgi:integrase
VVDAERDGLAPGTVRTCWRHLSSILQSAKEAKRIPDNPCRGYSTARPPAKPKQKARRLELTQGVAVRSALQARYHALFDLGAGAGLRQGEALGVSPADLDAGEIRVVRQVMRIRSRLCFGPPKGHKERTVPIPDALVESLKAHMEAFPPVEVTLPWVDPDLPNLPWDDRPKKSVRLLTTTVRKGAVNRSDWNMISWKPALAAAGVIAMLPPPEGMSQQEWERDARTYAKNRTHFPESREWGFHVLRHTFASTMLQARESPVTLAEWLGHSDPAFTLRTYTHFMPEAGGRGLAAMDAWLRGIPDEDLF